MKELEIQKLLRNTHSLENIKEEFGIKHNISGCGQLVNMKYCQINSDKNLQVVRECRGLILEIESWDIISRGFERFFNFGEEVQGIKELNFNSDKLSVLEKADGSIIQVFNYNGQWIISTSGVIGGTSNVHGGIMTFRELFERGAENYEDFWNRLDKNLVYVFELISPINQIVTPYEKTDLVLLNVRDRSNFHEFDLTELQDISKVIGVRLPKKFEVSTVDDIKNACESLPEKEEGFVIVDFNDKNEYGNYTRVKMKSTEYVKLHYLKDSAINSNSFMVNIILENEDAELSVTFPELKERFVEIRSVYNEIKNNIDMDWQDVRHLAKPEMTREEKAEFAKLVTTKETMNHLFAMQKHNCSTAHQLFEAYCRNDKSKNAFIRQIIDIGDLKSGN